MIKNVFILLIIFFLCVAGISTILFLQNKTSGGNSGFERILLASKPQLLYQKELATKKFRIAAFAENSVILNEHKKPDKLYYYSSNLTPIKVTNLNIGATNDEFKGQNSIAFFKHQTIILSGVSGLAYRSSSSTGKVGKSRISDNYFYNSVTISPDRFLLIQKVKEENAFRRLLVTTDTNGKINGQYMPEKQVDGYFCTDGQICYDRSSAKIVYLFYYRGQFITLDSNLKVTHKSKTIDTISRAAIRLGSYKSSITQLNPAVLVNKRMAVANELVYIQSALSAANESLVKRLEGEIIDVYKIESGQYLGSFYLPKTGGKKLVEFAVLKNRILVLYPGIVAVYSLPKITH